MGKTAVVFTCAHSKPTVSNERALWLSELIYDVRPDYVVDLGDTVDLQSLASQDVGKPGLMVMSNYEADIDHHLDFQEKLRYKVKKNKVKRPAYFGFEGNHEHRIKTALEKDPRLAGHKKGISFKDLETPRYYSEYHEYYCGAPALAEYDGVSYAHFVAAGNYGTAMSGEHHAYSLIKKRHSSTTVGHSHKRNVYFKDDAHPNPSIGLVAGCFKGNDEHWAGQANRDWWKGVVIKRNIQDGWYDPEFVSLGALKKAYGWDG